MAMEPVPVVIGDEYDVLQLIGRGNFGTVHLVRARDDGKYYVVKRIDTREMSPSELEGAVGEIQLLRRLHHPFIVRYRDSFLLGGILHLVMHYCEGGDLASQIRAAEGKHFPEEKILDWFVQIALALQYCHRHRIIHRDIKSQNIFLTDNHQVMLGDFGIARVLEGTNELAMSVVGTPYSMSPEVCENRPYGYASDIWALGCVLYEMCMLRHAFDANNLLGLVWKIVQENYPPIPSMYSSNLRELIKSMLQKQPEARPTIEQILVLDFIQARIRAMQEAAEQQSQVGEPSVVEDIDGNGTIGSFGSYHDASGTFSSLPPPTELEFHAASPHIPASASAARGYERFGAAQGFLSDNQLRSSAQSSDGTEELEAHADLQAVDEEELRREEENAAQFWSGQQNGMRPNTGVELVDPHFDRRQYGQYGGGTPSSTASAGSAGGHFGRDKSSPSNISGQDPRMGWNTPHSGQTLSGYTPQQPQYGAPPPTAAQQQMSSRDRVLYQKQMAKKMEEERYRQQLKALNSVNANSREEAKQRYFKNLASSQHGGAPVASGSPRTPQLQPPNVPGGVPPERRGSSSSSGPASPAGGLAGGVRSDQMRSRSAMGAGPVQPLNNPFSQARSPPYSSHAIQHPASAQPMTSPPYGYAPNSRGADVGAYNFQRHQSDSPVAYHGDRVGYEQGGHWRAAPDSLDHYGDGSLIDVSHPQFNGGEYYDDRMPVALHARAHSATPSFEGYPVPSLAEPKPGVLRSRGPPPSIRTREEVRGPASYPGSPASAGINGDRSSVSSSSPYAQPRDHVRVLDPHSQAAALGTPRVADRSLASYNNGNNNGGTPANRQQYSPPVSQGPSGQFVTSPSAAPADGEDEQYEEDFEVYEDSDTEDQDSWRNRTLKNAIQPISKFSAAPSASNTSLPAAANPRVPPLKTATAAPPPLAREPSEIVPFNSRHDALKNKILKQLTRPQFDKAYRYFHDRSNAAADPASLPDPREALGAELADVRNWDAVFLVEQLVFMEALPVFKSGSSQ